MSSRFSSLIDCSSNNSNIFKRNSFKRNDFFTKRNNFTDSNRFKSSDFKQNKPQNNFLFEKNKKIGSVKLENAYKRKEQNSIFGLISDKIKIENKVYTPKVNNNSQKNRFNVKKNSFSNIISNKKVEKPKEKELKVEDKDDFPPLN